MIRLVLIAGMLVFVAGCGKVNLRDSERSEHSQGKGSKALLIVPVNGTIRDGRPSAGAIHISAELDAEITRICSVTRPAQAQALPALVPLISTAGKFLFDMAMDAQRRKLEELKKAAQATYSDRVMTTVKGLRDAKCVLLLRYVEDTKPVKATENPEPNVVFAALLALKKQGTSGFTAEPVYIKVNKAAALTKKGSAENPDSIAVSMALSVKAIAKPPRATQPSLVGVAQGSVSVSRVQIGPTGKPHACGGACASTDLMPYPAGGDAEPVSLEVAVVETGDVGIDFDRVAAELKAMKEAFGPVLGDLIKELLKEEDK